MQQVSIASTTSVAGVLEGGDAVEPCIRCGAGQGQTWQDAARAVAAEVPSVCSNDRGGAQEELDVLRVGDIPRHADGNDLILTRMDAGRHHVGIAGELPFDVGHIDWSRARQAVESLGVAQIDRKSTRLNSSHGYIS